VRIIRKFAAEGKIDKDNWVNAASPVKSHMKVSIRHQDKVGVLSHCFKAFSEANWNV